MAGVDTCLERIDAFATANNEFIEQINAPKRNVNLITYVITRQEDGTHVVTEETTTSPAQTVTAQYQGLIELTQIPDIFNDKINYQCDKFDDMVRLNRDMLTIAHRFRFLRDEPAIQELNKFENNYRLIQTGLKQLLQLINTGGRGHLADIEEQIGNHEQLRARTSKIQ